jgi:hypothetical protein
MAKAMRLLERTARAAPGRLEDRRGVAEAVYGSGHM